MINYCVGNFQYDDELLEASEQNQKYGMLFFDFKLVL